MVQHNRLWAHSTLGGGAGSSPEVIKLFGGKPGCGTTLEKGAKTHPDQKKPVEGLEVGLETKRAKVVSLEGVC